MHTEFGASSVRASGIGQASNSGKCNGFVLFQEQK